MLEVQVGIDWRRSLPDGEQIFVVWFGYYSQWSQDTCPTLPALCRAITYKGPQPADVERVVRTRSRKALSDCYVLVCRKKCPVLFTGGGACPMCGEMH